MTITSESTPQPLAVRIASVRQHMLSEAATCISAVEIEKRTLVDPQHTWHEASKPLTVSDVVNTSFSPYQAWLFSPLKHARVHLLLADDKRGNSNATDQIGFEFVDADFDNDFDNDFDQGTGRRLPG